MPTENIAPTDQTPAPAGQADPALQTTSPPANGADGAAQGQPNAGTVDPAGSQDEKGTQQEADQGAAERDDQGRFKSKVQRRIDELTHARHAAEREAARWRAIAEGGQQAAPAPKNTDFDSDEAYQAAMLDHRIDERARQQAAANAKQAADQYQEDAQRAVADTYSQRVEAAAARIPDFVDVVGKADIQISNTLRDALMDSEHGPDIVYQLARNPAEAARLSSMGERQLYRELGRMEAAMVIENPPPRATAAPAARTTSAPPPASQAIVGGAPPSNDPSRMSQAEYEAWRKAQGSKYV